MKRIFEKDENPMFNAEFYPTPHHIIAQMFKKISENAKYLLDPSAGKGDIADYVLNRPYKSIEIDCIESSPELCAVLNDKDFSVVGHDFLSYDGVCYYDALIMNPPFSNGDEHLLRAWDFLHDGEIVCLLNAETIKNPHSKARKHLVSIIEEYGSVEYLGDCFSSAERKTSVQVAMVYLKKTAEDDSFDVWEVSNAEKAVNDDITTQSELPAVIDRLGNMQHFYDMGNEHMFKAFQHIRKAAGYMEANGINPKYDCDIEKILVLATKNINSAKAEFTKKHRNKSWHSVFSKMEFHKMLDKKQRQELLRDVDRNGKIPFTKENIKGTLQNVFVQRERLFEQSVANVFDELCRYYDGNTNHSEGWKTNDNYKINRKVIFPFGCEFNPKWGRYFSTRYGHQMDIYNDLDRILCVMTGAEFEKCRTIGKALSHHFEHLGRDIHAPFDNETESQFFKIKFYMKGTVHLTFKDKATWHLFNKTAAKGRAWLGEDTQRAAA